MSKVDAGASTRLDAFGAFIAVCADERAVPGPLPGPVPGPLNGITVAVKDNIAVAGAPFTAGLPLFADRVAVHDAEIVRRLKESGARVVGVTRTDAGGLGVTTPEVQNPVLPGHVVGGSSGGSAAAVAAGRASVGLGTDTGGSVRIPAACCGLVGFKPTHGILPLDGVWPLAPDFDAVGLMASDVGTIERVAATLFPTRVPRSERPLRLGVDRIRLAACEPLVIAVVERALLRLADAGIAAHDVSLPAREATMAAHGVRVLDAARLLYSRAWQDSSDQFPAAARRALATAESLTDDDISAARALTETIAAQLDAAFQALDAVVTPTLPVLPPSSDTRRVAFGGREVPVVSALVAETCLANLAGVPALSLPCPNPQNAFVSLQLMSPRRDDARLIAIAREIETILSTPN
jgi:aspartyl-tRNA(Asn)/glutamyl-tRNA(Gln) amidotransferase subunit A